jgi:esterase/lipase superfamily enzyme
MPPAVSTTVYFATNRRRAAAEPGGYGDGMTTDPDKVEYGSLPVTGTVVDKADSGALGAHGPRQTGGFDAPTRAAIIDAGRNLLVFVHGFANSFEDAVKRAAFNRAFLAASGQKAANTTVLAFTWPSLGAVIGSDPFAPGGQYLKERRKAASSGPALAGFLRHALGIVRDFRAATPGGRAFLLAHSMGNHALSAAVEPLLAAGAPPATFDEAVLAAADTDHATLEDPGQAGMFRLRELADRISVYASGRDLALHASLALNRVVPLGLDGAKSESDKTVYPPKRFRSVDCTLVFDLLKTVQAPAVDASHQYYRRSRTVAADIALLMADGKVKPGMSRLFAAPF